MDKSDPFKELRTQIQLFQGLQDAAGMIAEEWWSESSELHHLPPHLLQQMANLAAAHKNLVEYQLPPLDTGAYKGEPS